MPRRYKLIEMLGDNGFQELRRDQAGILNSGLGAVPVAPPLHLDFPGHGAKQTRLSGGRTLLLFGRTEATSPDYGQNIQSKEVLVKSRNVVLSNRA